MGLVNIFREYFFEFDTFLGVPAGHVWISPGSTADAVKEDNANDTKLGVSASGGHPAQPVAGARGLMPGARPSLGARR